MCGEQRPLRGQWGSVLPRQTPRPARQAAGGHRVTALQSRPGRDPCCWLAAAGTHTVRGAAGVVGRQGTKPTRGSQASRLLSREHWEGKGRGTGQGGTRRACWLMASAIVRKGGWRLTAEHQRAESGPGVLTSPGVTLRGGWLRPMDEKILK